MSLLFEKYTDMEHEYLVYDQEKNKYELTSHDIRWLYNRNFGVGLQAILVCNKIKEYEIEFTIYNPDGSIMEKDVTVHYEYDDDNRIKVSMGRKSFINDDVRMLGDRREVVNEPLSNGDKDTLCTCASVEHSPCTILTKEDKKCHYITISKVSKIIILNTKDMTA